MAHFAGKSERSCSFIWFGQFEIRAHDLNPAEVSVGNPIDLSRRLDETRNFRLRQL
jgi:hypothetical protein